MGEWKFPSDFEKVLLFCPNREARRSSRTPPGVVVKESLQRRIEDESLFGTPLDTPVIDGFKRRELFNWYPSGRVPP
jgi:hypothetical protein